LSDVAEHDTQRGHAQSGEPVDVSTGAPKFSSAVNAACRWNDLVEVAELPARFAMRLLAQSCENGCRERDYMEGAARMQRHRHQEFLRFLDRLERDIPA